LILEDLIKGTEEESGIFNYVDGKGNTKYISEQINRNIMQSQLKIMRNI